MSDNDSSRDWESRNRQMSCVEFRDRLAFTTHHDDEELRTEHDALADLVDDLLTGYNNIWVNVYDAESWHLGIVDRSKSDVSATTLERLRKEGLYVIHAGTKEMKYDDGTVLEHAFVEAKAHDQHLFTQIRENYL